jgi:microcystin-dependent protein
MPFAGSVAPEGYLLCDGSAVSRTDYADLFTAIGTTYGAGDGATTFNVPDLSGRVVLGVSQSHTLGSTGGEATHVLTSSELPAHVHEVPQHGHENDITATTPKFVHSVTQPAFKYNSPNNTSAANSMGINDRWCFTGTATGTASRATSAAITAHAASNCTMSGSVTDCDAFDSESTGTGNAHNNLQPYVAVSYIISTGL